MATTIQEVFDAQILPEWAQNNARVVELCKRNLSYRMKVIECATDTAWKKQLIKQANEWSDNA